MDGGWYGQRTARMVKIMLALLVLALLVWLYGSPGIVDD
jgi:hypothetical protein